jgi:hypothetical protein
MGLSAVAKSHISISKRFSAPRPPKGRKGISGNGKRMAKSSVKLMEQGYGNDRLFFGTTTCPPLALDEELKLSNNWSSIQKNFKTELGRRLESKGAPSEMVLITEIQPKRYKRTGRVSLHIHFIIVNRDYNGARWYLQRSDLNHIWQTVLSNKLNRSITVTSACQLDPCKKSASNEAGKYLSKGGKIIQDITKDGKSHFLPSNWYNISASLKAEVKEKTKTYSNRSIELFHDNLELFKFHGFIGYRLNYRKFYDERSPTKFREFCVGAAGFIKDEFIEEFKGYFENENSMAIFIGLLRLDLPKSA